MYTPYVLIDSLSLFALRSKVFELLETLYGAMDALAKKRNVYKVETIGDCYV